MKKLTRFIPMLVVISLIAIVAANTLDLDTLRQTLRGAQWAWLVPSSIVNVIVLGNIILRWQNIVGHGVRYWDCWHANQVGAYANILLPMRLGDVTRAYTLRRHYPNLTMLGILATVGAELTFDMLILMLLLAVVLMTLSLPPLLASAGAVLALATLVAAGGVFALARGDALLDRVIRPLVNRLLPARLAAMVLGLVGRMQTGLGTLRSNRQIVFLMGLSILGYVLQVFANWFLLRALVPDATLTAGLLALVGAALGLALPLLPGATGTFQLAVTLALTSVGIQPEAAAAFSVVLHAQQIIMTLFMGNIALLREGMKLQDLRTIAPPNNDPLSDQLPT